MILELLKSLMFDMDIKWIHGGTIQLECVTLDLGNPVPVADVINNDVYGPDQTIP